MLHYLLRSIRHRPFVWINGCGWFVLLAPTIYLALLKAALFLYGASLSPALLLELRKQEYFLSTALIVLAPLLVTLLVALLLMGTLWLAVDSEDLFAELFYSRWVRKRRGSSLGESASVAASDPGISVVSADVSRRDQQSRLFP